MAYYNYKELRDVLPPEMVDKWEEEDGSADYDSTLWSLGADYIEQLKKELDESRREAEEFRDDMRIHLAEGRGTFSWEEARNQATSEPK